MCISHIPGTGGIQHLCGRVENALGSEGESRVLNGHEEWPENILQALINPTISETMLIADLIYRRIKCDIRGNSAALVLAACARKR